MKQEEYTPEKLMELMRGYQSVCTIGAGLELDVFGCLDMGAKTAAAVARKLGCSERGMIALLNALASLNLLRKKGDTFSLTPFSKKHLVPGKPGYTGWMAMHSAHIQRSWVLLSDIVRTGKPAPRPPMDSEEGRVRHRNFIMAMHNFASSRTGAVLGSLDLRGVRRVLDVGGGPGTYAFAFARALPDAHVTIFDTPPTCAIARENIAAEKLGGRIDTVPGDFNSDPLGAGFDLILMSSILHIYSPAENKKLIKKAFKSLNPGGQLVVVEITVDKTGTKPELGAMFAINMLVNTETGSSYAPETMKPWFAAAGFEKVKTPLADERMVVVAGKKPIAKKH